MSSRRTPYASHGPRFRLRLVTALALILAPLFSRSARAEGTEQVGLNQPLRAGTTLYVDILDATVESIVWTGRGTVTLRPPDASADTVLRSGDVFAPRAGNGAYRLVVGQDQAAGVRWDVTVQGQVDSRGRLFSKNWMFNAGSYAKAAATNTSFYALVPAGSATSLSVIELKLEGLAGYIYDINANKRGVDGAYAGRSVPEAGHSTTPEYPIYLKVPSRANFASVPANVSELRYVGGTDRDVTGATITPCNQILPGNSRGYFSFQSSVEGSYHLQCDLDGDGDFSVSSGKDLLLIGDAAKGTNVLPWDGVHNGTAVAPTTYQCQLKVAVGEFHYVGRDIETSYPGMRIFRVNSDESRTGLPMYWNDGLVATGDIRMPNGLVGIPASEGAILPGSYTAPATPNVNARSWGDFSGAGKGNVSFLDTYVWMDEATSSLIEVRAADDTDDDGDGLTNYQESCLIGSDSDTADTDGDGTADGAQYALPLSSAFSGLESNGRMAAALARRAIRRVRMSPAPAVGVVSRSRATLISQDTLDAWLPSTLSDLSPVHNTPSDLLGSTNAGTVAGADYITASGLRRGSVLLVTADGAFYEHEKNVCDRVRGGRVLNVEPISIRGVPIFVSTVTDGSRGRLEYSAAIHLWRESASVPWNPAPLWILDDAPKLSPGASALTVQAWSDHPGLTRALLDEVIAGLESSSSIGWPVERVPVDDEDYRAEAAVGERSPDAEPPSALIQSAATRGGKIDLSLRRLAKSGDVELRFTALAEDGTTVSETRAPASLGVTPSEHHFELPGFLEVTADVIDAGRVVDRVWISDGAWAPFDDGIWTDAAGPAHFSRSQCANVALTEAKEPKWRTLATAGFLHLSGCAAAQYTGSSGGNGVARHLLNPLDARAFATLVYHARVDRPYQVCFEGDTSRECVALPARPQGAWEAIPIEAFRGASQDVEVISFSSSSSSVDIEIAGLNLVEAGPAPVDTRPEDEISSGCGLVRGGPSNPSAASVLLALLCLARRRARRAAKDRASKQG